MKSQSGLAIFAAIALTSISACGRGEASLAVDQESSGAAPRPVTVVAPSIRDIFATYETTAKIAADSEAPVVSRALGQITEISIEEGDRVQAGQVLARLDGERARLRMLQAKANLDKATRDYDRQISLRDRGLVSAASLDGLKFDVESLQASYELNRLDYEYTVIRAPISGVVALRSVKIGSHVNPNDSLFLIANTSKLVAYLRIPQTELSKFSAGNQADVRVDSMPGTSFRATIARISPTIDARNGTFRVTAYLDNADFHLAPGMFARFSIAYAKHSDAMLVPKSAIVNDDNDNVVYVVEDGSAIRRAVTIGIESADMIEILSGLNEGEKIIVTGQAGLRDGSKVLADIGVHSAASG